MDAPDARPEFSRGATIDDLIELCRHLNEARAQYVVIGGFAVIHYGYFRGTNDVDLLIEASSENVEKVRRALSYLPDQAIREVEADEIIKYEIVRIADEFVVDLLTKACGITYKQAAAHIEIAEIEGVPIPFLKPELLIKTKDTYRPKDITDREFLQEFIAREKEPEKNKKWWLW
jgi:hypothetical protein